jgi:hypothetical protein
MRCFFGAKEISGETPKIHSYSAMLMLRAKHEMSMENRIHSLLTNPAHSLGSSLEAIVSISVATTPNAPSEQLSNRQR